MKIILAIVLVAAVLPVPSQGKHEIVCEVGDTYLEHPSDCSKFYQCSNGYPYEFTCPGESFWSQLETACVTSNEHCIVPTTTTSTTSNPLDKHCRQDRAEEYKYKDPEDSQSYFVCLDNKYVRRASCRETLHCQFSESLQLCFRYEPVHC